MPKFINRIISFFKKIYTAFLIGMAKTERSALKDPIIADKTITNNVGSDLMSVLQRGEFNEEYVKQFFSILKKADEICYGTSYCDENSKYSGLTLTEKFNILKNERNLIKDDYEVEHFFTNEVYYIHNDDAYFYDSIEVNEDEEILRYIESNKEINQKESKPRTIATNVVVNNDSIDTKEYSFVANYDIETEYNLQNYSNSLIVKSVNNEDKILDFYFTNKELIIKPTLPYFNEIIKLKEFRYITKYGEMYIYRINYFDKYFYLEKNSVLRFRAKLIEFRKPEENLRKINVWS